MQLQINEFQKLPLQFKKKVQVINKTDIPDCFFNPTCHIIKHAQIKEFNDRNMKYICMNCIHDK